MLIEGLSHLAILAVVTSVLLVLPKRKSGQVARKFQDEEEIVRRRIFATVVRALAASPEPMRTRGALSTTLHDVVRTIARERDGAVMQGATEHVATGGGAAGGCTPFARILKPSRWPVRPKSRSRAWN